MSTEQKKPWDSWDVELPTATERKQCPEYKYLHDEKVHRELSLEIRTRAMAKLVEKLPNKSSAVVLQGGGEDAFSLYDSDVEKCPFRQEHYFQYLFWVNEPDCYGVVDLEKKESLLFVPKLPETSHRWNGDPHPLSHYKERYGVDHAFFTEDLDQELTKRGISKLFVLYGQNTDSGSFTKTTAHFSGIEKYSVDKDALHPVLSELRVHKTPKEIEFLRMANLISSQAHVYVMRHIKPDMTELQCEMLFKAWTGFFGGCRHMAYTCICGAGPMGAVLHYGHAGRPNDRVLKDGDIMVLDMGAEFSGYATDITRSYPINGKFTDDQKAVFDAVRDAQEKVMQAMKPGVSWVDMHKLAERTILSHLINMGVLANGSVDEMMGAFIGSLFMPHGLGHLLGMDTHDVGGYPAGTSRPKEPGPCWLRTARTLEAGMVITVEPGLYFNRAWIEKCLQNPEQKKYVNVEVLQRFWSFGGVRLEDDVLVTESGCENLTILPTTVEDIEKVMARK